MAIKIIKICDECGLEYLQFKYPKERTIICDIDFICSECKLIEVIESLQSRDISEEKCQ